VPRKGSSSQWALVWSCPSDHCLLGTFVVSRFFFLCDLHFSRIGWWFPLFFVVVPWFPYRSLLAVGLAPACRRSMSRLSAFEAYIASHSSLVFFGRDVETRYDGSNLLVGQINLSGFICYQAKGWMKAWQEKKDLATPPCRIKGEKVVSRSFKQLLIPYNKSEFLI